MKSQNRDRDFRKTLSVLHVLSRGTVFDNGIKVLSPVHLVTLEKEEEEHRLFSVYALYIKSVSSRFGSFHPYMNRIVAFSLLPHP